MIVSSRAPLRVSGEQEFPVPPLSLPPPDVTDPDALMASEGVRLFVERAMAVRPDFSLTAENAVARRGDRSPARRPAAGDRAGRRPVRLLSPAAMSQRLGDRLGLLSAGGRDLPERQRTLRGAIDWSHDLLDPKDQRLFARLGVFAGGGPIETAESVCEIPGDTVSLDVPGGLERLAEQSLMGIGDDLHGDVRFTMLETIREYALDKLEERGETGALKDRHAAAFAAFAVATGPKALDTTAAAAAHARLLDRLEDEHDNLRSAVEHLTTTGDTGGAADLVFALWRFWHMRGHITEGRVRVDRVLAMPQWTEEPTRTRLRALEAAGGLAYWGGDLVSAGTHYRAAVDVARALGDEGEIANAVYNLFFARRPARDSAEWIDVMRGDDTSLLDEALEIWTRLGDDSGMGKALWGLSEWYGYRSDFVRAEDAASRAIEIFERIGDPFWVSWSRFTRAFGRVMARDLPGAARDLGPTLREFWASRDLSGLVLVLSAASSTLLLVDRPVDGYEVGGAARRLVAETGLHLVNLWPSENIPIVDPDTADPELRAAISRGSAWSRDEAVERAIAYAAEIAQEAPAPA